MNYLFKTTNEYNMDYVEKCTRPLIECVHNHQIF